MLSFQYRIKEYYTKSFNTYGVSPKALGWIRGKQSMRFYELTKRFELDQRFRFLDIGCGFGDINTFFFDRGIKNYTYTGVDIMQEFIDVASEAYKSVDTVSFVCDDYRTMSISGEYDYIIGAGIFNVNLLDEDNYSMVKEVMSKAMLCCKDKGAIAFDFQSDKVDYKADSEYAFYYSPEKILEIAYGLSRNVILDNSYFPFEFSVTVFKDDSFDSDLIFNRYQRDRSIMERI